jgi:hypothetical protein
MRSLSVKNLVKNISRLSFSILVPELGLCPTTTNLVYTLQAGLESGFKHLCMHVM